MNIVLTSMQQLKANPEKRPETVTRGHILMLHQY